MSLLYISSHHVQLTIVPYDAGPVVVRLFRSSSKRVMVVVHPVIVLEPVYVIPVKVRNDGFPL